MTWGEFTASARGFMGAYATLDSHPDLWLTYIKQAIIDLQQTIPAFKAQHETIFQDIHVKRDGFASRGKLPAGAMLKEIWMKRRDVTQADSEAELRPVEAYPWADRNDLIKGVAMLNDGVPKIAIDPETFEFLVFPALNTKAGHGELGLPQVLADDASLYNLSVTLQPGLGLGSDAPKTMVPVPDVGDAVTGRDLTEKVVWLSVLWSGQKTDYLDAEKVVFPEECAFACGLYAQAMLALNVDHDRETWAMCMGVPGKMTDGTYRKLRQRMFLDLAGQAMIPENKSAQPVAFSHTLSSAATLTNTATNREASYASFLLLGTDGFYYTVTAGTQDGQTVLLVDPTSLTSAGVIGASGIFPYLNMRLPSGDVRRTSQGMVGAVQVLMFDDSPPVGYETFQADGQVAFAKLYLRFPDGSAHQVVPMNVAGGVVLAIQ